MRIIIAEDEPLTANRLKKMIAELLTEKADYIFTETVSETLEELAGVTPPDLLLLDVHLADGSSLDIFAVTTVSIPVIFTTAYDEHAVRAFRLNAVDYLLKPINKDELAAALLKWRAQQTSEIDYAKLVRAMKTEANTHRFLIKSGQQIHLVEATEVAFFSTEDRLTILTTLTGKRHVLDQSLDRLETELDANQFFRVNRQFIVQRRAIKEMHAYSKARVKLVLTTGQETIVSTERSPHFKEWLVSGV
ncbi:DNA-binding response regulator [Lewinellaceae bacterium SD302]|nr:DNA-binding response regulator [Lewinellaceae bacterium SD302]